VIGKALPIIVLAAALSVCALLLPPASSGSGPKACVAPGSTTVTETEDARVYWRTQRRGVRGSERRRRARVRVLYGCRRQTARRWRLGIYGSGASKFIPFGNIKLAGRYVAYVRGVCFFVNDCGFSIRVRDLKTGAIKFDSGGEKQRTSIYSFVLKSNGSIAWIANEFDSTNVHKDDSHGHQVIDSSKDPTFDLGSLALSADGMTIYWKRAFNEVRFSSLD
jgi:hypothetical protein